ncbi:MAG: 30S ribosomal protein S21 [Alphaproteobacteria bacterium]|nr:MAG: 30S ribosomal protein S21 [Alphaproteobacteria bacterium]
MKVSVAHGDTAKGLKDLRKGLQKSGISSEIRKRRHYEKPSIIKARKRKEQKRQIGRPSSNVFGSKIKYNQ